MKALSKQDDFHQLQAALLEKYMNASNAKLNYDKTQVLLSLSGTPHPHWQTFLQDQGIQSWHDRRSSSPEPLMYILVMPSSSPTPPNGLPTHKKSSPTSENSVYYILCGL
ncbi:hypothetical protein HMPREF1544_03277 [Mucor circinelloides 1006PhL]|uniref:Reverse transcriptase domain-containing protein n=1 Tax=Mucor circinelloides f. circinelloides (strain 1006PhL) TaxID=1220926 RepID=S2JJ26_MUCC1|nr:hypothetical protein HMPREF1544_03277 [Mucor circinelloides 1006PhL]